MVTRILLAVWTLLFANASFSTVTILPANFPAIFAHDSTMKRQYLSLTYIVPENPNLDLIAQALNDGLGKSQEIFVNELLKRQAKIIYIPAQSNFEIVIYSPPETLGDVARLSIAHLNAAIEEIKNFGEKHAQVIYRKNWHFPDERSKLQKIMEFALSGETFNLEPPKFELQKSRVEEAITKITSFYPDFVVSIGPAKPTGLKAVLQDTFNHATPKGQYHPEVERSSAILSQNWGNAYILPTNDRQLHFILAKKVLPGVSNDVIELLTEHLTSGPASYLTKKLRNEKKLVYGMGGYLRFDLGAWIIESQGAIEEFDEVLTELNKGLAQYAPNLKELQGTLNKKNLELASKLEFPPNRIEIIRQRLLGGLKLDDVDGKILQMQVPLETLTKNFIEEIIHNTPRILFVAGNPLIVKGVLIKHGYKADRIHTIKFNN